MTSEQIAFDAAASPFIAGLVMMAKKYLPVKFTAFLPLIALGFGIAYAMLARPGCQMSPECLTSGFQVGLMAVGLHSSFKNAMEKPKT